MDSRQRLELARAEPMKTMMAQRELAIAALDTGTRALKSLNTSLGQGFKVMTSLRGEGLNGGIRVAQWTELF